MDISVVQIVDWHQNSGGWLSTQVHHLEVVQTSLGHNRSRNEVGRDSPLAFLEVLEVVHLQVLQTEHGVHLCLHRLHILLHFDLHVGHVGLHLSHVFVHLLIFLFHGLIELLLFLSSHLSALLIGLADGVLVAHLIVLSAVEVQRALLGGGMVANDGAVVEIVDVGDAVVVVVLSDLHVAVE